MITDTPPPNHPLIPTSVIPFPHIVLVSSYGLQTIYAYRYCNNNTLDRILLVSIDTEDEITVFTVLQMKVEVTDEIEEFIPLVN